MFPKVIWAQAMQSIAKHAGCLLSVGQFCTRARQLPFVTILVAYFLCRIMAVVIAEPIIGYANNFDFARQSACVGVWQHYPDRAKYLWHWEAPVAALQFDGDERPDECTWSIDNIFPYLASKTHRLGDAMDLREVGIVKLLASLGVACLLLLGLPRGLQRAAGMAALLVIAGDFDALSFFNTLYVETSQITALAGFLISGAALLSAQKRPALLQTFMPVGFLLCLGLDKAQWGAFAAISGLALSAIMAMRWHANGRAIMIALMALAAPTVFVHVNDQPRGLLPALAANNHLHTLYGALWQASPDTRQALTILRLPDTCAVGVSDFAVAQAMRRPPCAEAKIFARARLLPLFAAQPSVLIKTLHGGLERSKPSRIDRLARSASADISSFSSFNLLRVTSITYLMACCPLLPYEILTALTMAVGTLMFAYEIGHSAIIGNRPSLSPSFGFALCAMSGTASAYSLVSSVYGDGYEEIWRHALSVPLCTGGFLVGLAAIIIHRAAHTSLEQARPSP